MPQLPGVEPVPTPPESIAPERPERLPPVGETPLVEVDGVKAKLECVNPCGSIKDRLARYVLTESRRRGLLAPGQPIVEATSGNTGIALAYFAARLGHRVTIVMPENMTAERKQILRSLGAELVLVSAEGSFAEAAAVRDRLARDHGWFNPDQFSNPLNVECHERTTGAELVRQLRGRPLDAFVAGVGTGGTLVGVGRALRAVYPKVQLIAVEPEESAVMSGGAAGEHGISGIGDGFVPALATDGGDGLHSLIGKVVRIATADAVAAARDLADRHGLCVGISSGANFLAAAAQRRHGFAVATVFPDGFTKYRSRGLEPCEAGRCPFEHELALPGLAASGGLRVSCRSLG